MQALRDDPQCAREAFEAALEPSDPGLSAKLTFRAADGAARERARRPAQGRGAARAGRQRPARDGGDARARGLRGARRAHDGSACRARKSLEGYRGVIACGGFSYGDVLGAGEGWAKTILYHERARPMFARVFRAQRRVRARCLQRLPDARGAEGADSGHGAAGPSSCATARTSSKRACRSSRSCRARRCCSPAWRARACRSSRRTAKGRAELSRRREALAACDAKLTAMRFVTNDGAVAERYPANPNGSPHGHRGSVERRRPRDDHDAAPRARVPHGAASWHPAEWGECSPWQRLFDNARAWVG